MVGVKVCWGILCVAYTATLILSEIMNGRKVDLGFIINSAYIFSLLLTCRIFSDVMYFIQNISLRIAICETKQPQIFSQSG